MGHEWIDPPKRRSPMDSGNNGTWLEKLAKALAQKLLGEGKKK